MTHQNHRIIIVPCAALAVCGLTFLISTPAQSGGQGSALVRLQAASPGTPQVGALNVSGVGLLGELGISTAGIPMGITSELGGTTPLMNFDVNFRQASKNTTIAGGALRIDTRPAQPAFQFMWRPAGGSDTTLAVLTSSGRFGVGRSNPLGQIEGYSTADGRYGVVGMNTGTTGWSRGVYGESRSADGQAVVGWNPHATGLTYAVDGEVASINGVGVRGLGRSTSGPNIGVLGETWSTTGYGIYGNAPAATGVTFGVYGSCGANGSGYGMYSNGRIAVSGTKSFQIDHPLDPEHKLLNHYCTEGAEPLNAYSGNITTDSRGYATVQLPSYFESINKDFRYQLSVIDDSNSDEFVLAKVVRRIEGNNFVIRTSSAGVEVSWRVEATRNDRFVEEHGAPVEIEKTESQQGKYVMPDLYGQPKERGMFFKAQNATGGQK